MQGCCGECKVATHNVKHKNICGMFEVCANYEDQCGHVLSAPNVKLNRFSLNVSIYHKVTAA